MERSTINVIKNAKFLKLLVSKMIITDETCRFLRQKFNDNAFAILLHLAATSSSQKAILGRLWGDSIGVAFMDLRTSLFQSKVVTQIPEKFARKNQIILVYQFGDAITAALANPLDSSVVKQTQEIIGNPISPIFSFPDDIEYAIEIEYKTDDYLNDLSRKIITDTIRIEDISELTKDELTKVAGDQAVVEFVHGLMLLAVREGASDIHIQPGEEKARVRFRIDGLLQDRSNLEKALLPPIVSRIKVLSNLDITERRRPQDGRVSLDLPNKTIDFRISTVPTIHGEKIVLRILGQTKTQAIPDVTDLAFSKINLGMIRRVLDSPHGIFFVTGPTGSGKTTTLFAMLKELNKPGTNITTIEDPVEYKLAGISQVQVNSAVDLDFASALRSFLRQDPDIILVGEIRDFETAHIACQAALTGHLVLATLHTNTAVQSITRLLDIGVKPFVVAPSLIGVMCQRLVRKLCEHCREPHPAKDSLLSQQFDWKGKDVSIYSPKGCPQCNNSGYSGRIAIHELILVDDEMRGMIARGESVSIIQSYATRTGFQTMRYDGIKKILRGLTTLEEVNRITSAEERIAFYDGSKSMESPTPRPNTLNLD